MGMHLRRKNHLSPASVFPDGVGESVSRECMGLSDLVCALLLRAALLFREQGEGAFVKNGLPCVRSVACAIFGGKETAPQAPKVRPDGRGGAEGRGTLR